LSIDLLENETLAPLIAAIVGSVVIALAAVERLLSARREVGESRLRRYIMYLTVALTMTINIALYWFQYHNVTTVRKRTEHELALSLWAYTDHQEIALRYLAKSSTYMLGYYYFRAHEFAPARRALNESIAEGSFVAPAHYILAVMARTTPDPTERDLNEAMRQVDAALAYDPNYSSAHQERGLLFALRGQRSLALDEIQTAVRISTIHCYSVIRKSQDDTDPFYLLRNEPRFIRLRRECEELEAHL
jgi:hypothetical protein